MLGQVWTRGPVSATTGARPLLLSTAAGAREWGRSDLNRRPTDYESDRNPHGTLTIRRFVLGCLTLADLTDQRFSPLCATNVPHELSGCLGLLGRAARSVRRHPVWRMEPEWMGEWHLETDVPSAEDAV